MAIVTTNDIHYQAIADELRLQGGDAERRWLPEEMARGVALVSEHQYNSGSTDGKLSLLRESRHLNASVSGTVLAIKDMSPVAHDVTVTVSGAEDVSAVTVKQYGKNLCPNVTSGKTSYGITYTRNADGTVTVNGTATADSYFDVVTSGNPCPYLPVGTVLRISGCPAGGTSETYYLELPWVGWYEYGKGVTVKIPNETQAGHWRKCIRINVKSGVTMDNVVFKPQVELGDYSEYEPYIPPTVHTVSADGTVQGVKSLSPSMTLLGDPEGVVLECSYLRDIDTYIDHLMVAVALTGGE